MAQHDTPTPPRGMTLRFGQRIDYFAHEIVGGRRYWCAAVVINPDIEDSTPDDEIGVAYWSPKDGFQWTDRAKIEDVRIPEYDAVAAENQDLRDSLAMAEAQIKDLERANNTQANTIATLMENREQRESGFLTLMMQRGLEIHSKNYMRMLESKAQVFDELAGRLLHPVAADILSTVRTLADQDYTIGRIRYDQSKATILDLLDTLLSSVVDRRPPRPANDPGPRPHFSADPPDPDKPF
jgi:hypothetical protein